MFKPCDWRRRVSTRNYPASLCVIQDLLQDTTLFVIVQTLIKGRCAEEYDNLQHIAHNLIDLHGICCQQTAHLALQIIRFRHELRVLFSNLHKHFRVLFNLFNLFRCGH